MQTFEAFPGYASTDPLALTTSIKSIWMLDTPHLLYLAIYPSSIVGVSLLPFLQYGLSASCACHSEASPSDVRGSPVLLLLYPPPH